MKYKLSLLLLCSFFNVYGSQTKPKSNEVRQEDLCCIKTFQRPYNRHEDRSSYRIELYQSENTPIKLGTLYCSWNNKTKEAWISGINVKADERRKKHGSTLFIKTIEKFVNNHPDIKTIGWFSQPSLHEGDYIPLETLEKHCCELGAVKKERAIMCFGSGTHMRYPLTLAHMLHTLIPIFDNKKTNWIVPLKLVVAYYGPTIEEIPAE